MTVIVGLVDNGAIWLGGDSGGVGPGWLLSVRSDPKVFRTGPYLMGFTSSFRMGQLLRWTLKPASPTGDLERFMATVFVDSVRQCLKDGGWATTQEAREVGGGFLIGVSGRLFNVADDYQVGEAAAFYDAVGCGAETALGAMYASSGLKPAARLRVALGAAERHNAGVRGPYVVLHSKAHIDG